MKNKNAPGPGAFLFVVRLASIFSEIIAISGRSGKNAPGTGAFLIFKSVAGFFYCPCFTLIMASGKSPWAILWVLITAAESAASDRHMTVPSFSFTQ